MQIYLVFIIVLRQVNKNSNFRDETRNATACAMRWDSYRYIQHHVLNVDKNMTLEFK